MTHTERRVKRFTDWLIRSEYAEHARYSNVHNDYGIDSRFGRCMDAAEDGADGSTHAEIIDDWRDAFRCWLRERERGSFRSHDRFQAAVEAYFDSVWDWHVRNGSIDKQVG